MRYAMFETGGMYRFAAKKSAILTPDSDICDLWKGERGKDEEMDGQRKKCEDYSIIFGDPPE